MFKKIVRPHPYDLGTPRFFHNPYFLFSIKTRTYVPMTPLTPSKFNLIYANQEYMKGHIIRPAHSIFFWTPALLVALNNYLTEWSYLSTSGFVGLFLFGTVLRSRFKSKLFNEPQSIEVSSDLQTFYIAVPDSNRSLYYSEKVFINKEQGDFFKVQDYYHPLFTNFDEA